MEQVVGWLKESNIMIRWQVTSDTCWGGGGGGGCGPACAHTRDGAAAASVASWRSSGSYCPGMWWLVIGGQVFNISDYSWFFISHRRLNSRRAQTKPCLISKEKYFIHYSYYFHGNMLVVWLYSIINISSRRPKWMKDDYHKSKHF